MAVANWGMSVLAIKLRLKRSRGRFEIIRKLEIMNKISSRKRILCVHKISKMQMVVTVLTYGKTCALGRCNLVEVF